MTKDELLTLFHVVFSPWSIAKGVKVKSANFKLVGNSSQFKLDVELTTPLMAFSIIYYSKLHNVITANGEHNIPSESICVL